MEIANIDLHDKINEIKKVDLPEKNYFITDFSNEIIQ